MFDYYSKTWPILTVKKRDEKIIKIHLLQSRGHISRFSIIAPKNVIGQFDETLSLLIRKEKKSLVSTNVKARTKEKVSGEIDRISYLLAILHPV